MKTKAIILLMLACIGRQHAQETFRIECLSNASVIQAYPTTDEKGKPLELITAVKVVLNKKQCLPRGIPITLVSERKKEFLKPLLYRWDPAAKSWVKEQALTVLPGNKTRNFKTSVRCPGIYGVFDAVPPTETGLVLSVPSDAALRSVKIIQQEPAMSYYWEEQGGRELKIPFGALQFDAEIKIAWDEKGVRREGVFLAGALGDFNETLQPGQPRELKLKPGKTIEFHQQQFTSK
jgi:hypothetical protein